MALSSHRIAERNCSGRAKAAAAHNKFVNALIRINKKYQAVALASRHPSELRSFEIVIYNFG
jgi:hypothetical protein